MPQTDQYQPPFVRSGSPKTASFALSLACFLPMKIDEMNIIASAKMTIAAIAARLSDIQSSTAHNLFFHVPDHCEDFFSDVGEMTVLLNLSQGFFQATLGKR